MEFLAVPGKVLVLHNRVTYTGVEILYTHASQLFFNVFIEFSPRAMPFFFWLKVDCQFCRPILCSPLNKGACIGITQKFTR